MATPSVKLFTPQLLVLALLAGCASSPTRTLSNAPSATLNLASPTTTALATPQARVQFHVMAGQMAAGRHQPGAAAQQFFEALQDDPDPKLASRATALALNAGDDALALKAAQKWLEIDPSSGNAREAIVRLALRQNQPDVALKQCRELIGLQPDSRALGYRLVAQLLSQEPDHAAAATSVMDKLLADDDDYAPAHEAAALLALRLDDPTRAEAQARKALVLTPDAKDASLLLVGALIRQDRLDDADTVMTQLYKGDAHAQALRLGYSQMLVQAHHSDHARSQLQQILAHHPRNDDALYLMALIDLEHHQLDSAEHALNSISDDSRSRSADVQYYLGRISEERNEPNAALEHYAKVTSGSQVISAATRRAVLLGKLGRVEESESVLRHLSRSYPQLEDQFIITESQILVNAGNTDQAADLLNQALQVEPDNPDLLYSRSLVYDQLGRVKEAESDLRTVLAQSPNDARALNALGYMLSVHNPDQLDEAQHMIGRALKLTPDDPAVIDSMGWVLYRQGHPDQALPLLRKAYSLFPDPEVAAHLVAVLTALGDKDQAHQVLDKALKDDPSDPHLLKAADQLGQ